MRARLLGAVACAWLLAVLAPALAAIVVVNNVPDWNQPYDGFLPDPTPALPTDPYDNYCVPTAAGNLYGWWEDQQGSTGIADRQVAPATPAYPNNAVAPTWQQGLWHDGVVELGWYFDANDVDPAQYLPNPNDGHLGTKVAIIAAGLSRYAQAAWQDPNTAIQKVAFGLTAWSFNNPQPGTSPWDDYVADINAGRPALLDFDYWNPVVGGADPNYPQVAWFYQWGAHPGGSLGHTVTGVGYLDVDGNNATDADKFWIVHDTWSSTFGTIALPYFAFGQSAYAWQQTDHLLPSAVPEPGLLTLLAVGLALQLAWRRWQRSCGRRVS